MKTKNYFLVITLLTLLTLFNLPFIVNGQENDHLNFQLEAGYGVKLDKGDYNSFQVHLSPLYEISNTFKAGIGTGLVFMHRNSYSEKARNLTFVPAYFNVNYTLNKNNMFTPFAGVKVGYGFCSKNFTELSEPTSAWNGEEINTNIKGDLFYSVTLGILRTLPHGHDLSFSLSYDLQRARLKMGRDNRYHEQTYNLTTLSLKVGYFF